MLKKQTLLLPFLILMFGFARADYRISGKVLDDKEKPIRGANVYLDNTIDGATTDSMGVFSFTTSEKGNQTIVASEVSHETSGLPIVVMGDVKDIVLHMKSNKLHDLDLVVITAGSFDASNDKSKTVLKPLDIVTTAGANADVVKAIEMLPGTQQTGSDNGLFVRGGDASEASILVDEMVVQNAFISGPPGVSTRSRFGAFNYQGVSFSSGGYSARYGQALSGLLELNTTDIADKSTVNLGINMAGVYASGTKKWKNASLDFGANYNNLTPFYGIATTNFKFYEVPVGGGGNLRYVWKPKKDATLKVSLNTSLGKSGITIPNPYAGVDTNGASSMANSFARQGDNINFVTKDQYYYGNASYRQMWKGKYSLYTAASYSLDKTDNSFGPMPITQEDFRNQFRIEGKRYFTARLNLLVGTDIQNYGNTKNVFISGYNIPEQKFTETLVSGYTEAEWSPINLLSFKGGVRYEQSNLLDKATIAPRFSMAIKTSNHSQASFASGLFYQDPDNAYLLAGLRPGMQQSVHYILNWQYSKSDRTLRLEGYYKQYSKLVLEQDSVYNANAYRTIAYNTMVNNNGSGYAKGLELFYRDKKSIKNLDYWVSYSYIDTRRMYSNFPTEATPTFIADNNLSLVGKYFVDKWHTSLSATYSFASGRPYYNPLNDPSDYSKFLSDRTKTFNNIAVSAAWLHTFGKWFTVFYISIDNIANIHNEFGYRYVYNAGGQPTGQRNPIVPAMYRSIFFGVNMSLTQFSKDEL